jgi:endonuclease YncB( thermonuclease family)
VNERMVLDGYEWAHDYPPNLTRQGQLWVAHAQARAAGIGVWSEEGR